MSRASHPRASPYELVHKRALRHVDGMPQLLVRRVGVAVLQVLGDGAREEPRLHASPLTDEAWSPVRHAEYLTWILANVGLVRIRKNTSMFSRIIHIGKIQ